MIVFPAVDIQDGKAVRLRRGNFDEVTVFGDDPVEMARHWRDQGAEALHIVDLDAARTGELANLAIVERIVKALDIPVQYGGGIRSAKSLALVAGIGVHWVVMGTAAITALDLLDQAVAWLHERLVVGLDSSGGMVATHGWQQRSQMSTVRFAKVLAEHDVRRVVYTDTSRDGMLGGPDLMGLAELAEATSHRDRPLGRCGHARRPAALEQGAGAQRGRRGGRSRSVREGLHLGRGQGRLPVMRRGAARRA